jgi:trehalose-phosphatase
MRHNLLEHLTEIGDRLDGAPVRLLFLDFDGTLTPLVDTPEQAHLSPAIRDVLRELVDRDPFGLAIISGRERADLHARVNVPGLIYAGNHGLEISGPGFLFIEPTAVACREALDDLADDLAIRLQPIAGALVEDKGLTLGIHYRQVAPGEHKEVHRIVQSALANPNRPFGMTEGARVHEIRPWVYWNKGTAVKWIQEKLGRQDALIIYIGDDVTDEDAFAALPDGITVKVGKSADTRAQYQLKGPAEVQQFLHWLASRSS